MGSKSAEQFQSNQSDTVLPESDYQILKFSEIAVQFVNNQLQHLDSYKATGEDNIKYRLLKDAAHIVSEAQAKIMNNSLQTGKTPSDWQNSLRLVELH